MPDEGGTIATHGDLPVSRLLRAKLRAPTVPDHYVRRARLLRLVDEAIQSSPLTLVCAPAGTGKTVLLSGWAAECELPVSWLSLDESDRDGSQLWPSVIAAVEPLAPGCGAEALALVRRSAGLRDAAFALLDDLDGDRHPRSVLVIDDVQYVDVDEDVASSLAVFVQHLPEWLRVVLLARREPRLPLDRLRARGQLGEVTYTDLSFSAPEAHEMLERLVPGLAGDQMDSTAAHAAGWAAGLQLAALAARSAGARGDTEPPTAPGDGLVEDYLWRDVFAGEDRDLVEMLLDVAVVDRIEPSLARALAGRDDTGELLRRAEARGLFVARRGPDGWFDLHALVRSALVAELHRRSPERLAERHVRAARWLEEAGATGPALDHWLAAGRPRDALRLLAATGAELYDNGDEATIRRTLAALPPGVATTDLGAMQDFAWCHVLVDRRRFVELVDETVWWAEKATTTDEALRGRLATVQSIAAVLSGRWADGGDLARRGVQTMGDAWWRDPLGRFAWNMVAREVALSERWDDAGAEVREIEHMLCRVPQRRLAFEGTRALGEALAGRPTDALRVVAGVRHAAEVTNMTILRTELAIAEAIALREIGDRERALPMLEALAEGTPEPMLYCRVLAQLELAQARLDDGDVDAACAVFSTTETLVALEAFQGGGRDWLTRTGVHIALAQGKLDQARHLADRLGDPFWRGICAARVHLATGDRSGSAATLDPLDARCVRHEVVLKLLQARSADDHAVATKAATAAVELAAANGILQTVASEGPDIVELAEQAAWGVPSDWLGRLRRLPAQPQGHGGTAGPRLVEALTDRERDVLRFLPSRLTIPEIANELYLSVNTLKFHLKAIYRKLGVGSRAEAAEAARRMTAL